MNFRNILGLCLGLFGVYSIVALSRLDFPNEAYFGGDSGGYQIMAVNWMKGKGLMRNGGVAGDYYEDYKLSRDFGDAGQEGYEWFLETAKTGGYFQFYRTPGYIIFLGLVYRLFGVSPEIAKQIQLLMITAIAGFLPLVGNYFWKKRGVLAGIMAGPIYMYYYARSGMPGGGITYPSDILTETLGTFGLFILVAAYIVWNKKRGMLSTLIMGLVSGVNLMIKGSVIFIPILLSGYMLWLVIKKNLRLHLWLIFIAGIILIVLPWSIYATNKSGQTILLSTQGKFVLLEGNNEYVTDGGWHPEGYSLAKPNAFYKQPGIEMLSTAGKIWAFYSNYPQLIPVLLTAKLKYGFETFLFFRGALTLLTYKIGVQIIEKISKKNQLWKKRILLTWLIFTLLELFMIFYTTVTIAPQWMGWGVPGQLLLLSIVIIFGIGILGSKLSIDLPIVLAAIGGNFLLLTVAVFGYPRFIQVADFVFILLACKYGLDVLVDMRKYGLKQV